MHFRSKAENSYNKLMKMDLISCPLKPQFFCSNVYSQSPNILPQNKSLLQVFQWSSSSHLAKQHFAVKPSRVRSEFVNGALSADSDPRFIDRVRFNTFSFTYALAFGLCNLTISVLKIQMTLYQLKRLMFVFSVLMDRYYVHNIVICF